MAHEPSHLRKALSAVYRIEGEIGEGGMAVVFEAHDLKHERPVALKVLRPELAAALGAERFLREIHIAAHLQHPHILPLYDSGRADGFLYFVMPRVEGETLRARLDAQTQLSVEEAVRLAAEIAEALDYAHAHDIVHRDIKPENIFVTSGHALVADFGIARAITVAGTEELTRTGVAIGTPSYMSPEQATGKTRVDGRSDLYSLACVLYEMLAGEPPFTGPTAQAIIARQMASDPPPLRVVRPAVPVPVESVLRRALEKLPADRFASGRELASALLEALRLGAGQSGALASEAATYSRQRAFATRILGIATVITLAAGAALVFQWKMAQPPPLDPNKVVVYPLVNRSTVDEAAGEAAAVIIGAGLEHTEPLRWIDGWGRLDPATRRDPTLLTSTAAREIAVERGAAFYVDGVVFDTGDSLAVSLKLNDTAGDSVVARATVGGAVGERSVGQLGLLAMVDLLPPLVDPGREVDLAHLTERDPGAIANWIQGERQYRLSRFPEALLLYNRAVAADSQLALAALKGAQAAQWVASREMALSLIDAAVKHESVLPYRHRQFAYGLREYLNGRRDNAIQQIRSALSEDPEWSEGWTLLGEVYRHLLPAQAPFQDSARISFAAAVTTDPDFTPPLIHRLEYVAQDGSLTEATAIVERLREAGADPSMTLRMRLILDCMRDGQTPWQQAVAADPVATLEAAKHLSWLAGRDECALAGFAAARNSDDPDYAWGGLLGLQSMLVARGRFEEAASALDSAVAAGQVAANFAFILGALAGAPMDQQVVRFDEFIRGLRGDDYDPLGSLPRFLLGVWHAEQADTARAALLLEHLRNTPDETPGRLVRVFHDALLAHLTVARGDTARAIALLRDVQPEVHPFELGYSLAEPMAPQRLLLARLLLARGEFEEAIRVAAVFDHPQPVIYLAYRPSGLLVRLRAAEALGAVEQATAAREALLELGRADLVKGSLPSTGRSVAAGPTASTSTSLMNEAMDSL